MSRCELSRSQKSKLEPLQKGLKHWTQSHHQNDLPFPLQSFVVFSHVVWPHRQSRFTAHHLEGSRPSMVSSQPQADQWFGDVRSISLVKSGSFGQLRSMHTLARFWSLLVLYNPGSSGSRVRLSVLSTPPSVCKHNMGIAKCRHNTLSLAFQTQELSHNMVL